MFRSTEREEYADFSEPFSLIYHVLFIRRDSPPFADLSGLSGKALIVQRDSYAHDYLREHPAGARIIPVHTEPEAVWLLASGRGDCALVTRMGGRDVIRRSGLENVITGSPPLLPRDYCLAVAKGRSALLCRINRGLSVVKASGKFDDLYEQWLGHLIPSSHPWLHMLGQAAWVLVPLLFLALLALAWSWTLRRRVALRTAELDRSNRVLLTISEVNEAMVRAGSEEDLYPAVCRILARPGRYKGAWVGVGKPGDPESLRVLAAEVRDQGGGRGEGPGAAAALPGRTTCLSALACGRSVQDMERDLGRIFALPLRDKETAFGCLTILSDDSLAFTGDEARMLKELAEDLAFRVVALRTRKERDRALEQMEDRRLFLEAVVRAAPSLILVVDQERRILAFNSACEEATGLSGEEVLGKGLEVLPLGPEVAALFTGDRALSEVRARRAAVEAPAVSRNGESRIIEWRVTAMPWARGEERAILGSGVDVTDQRQLEDQLRQAQKMEAVGRLAGGIAHDFNNMLSVINGYADMILETLPPGDVARADLLEIRGAGDRAAALTRQLLAFSRRQIVKPEIMDLNRTVEKMRNLLLRLLGENITLVLSPAADLNRVKADPGQIEQVIMNLAINARDAMPRGGTITIETSNAQPGRVMTGMPLPAIQDGVMLTVTDTGDGMDETTRKGIFEPFFTTKGAEKGTGLGLATVYGIVQQSGGRVWVESELGRGIRFHIILPRAQAPEQEEAAAAEQSSRGTETILLAEDESSVRNLAIRILEGAGYKVLASASAEEALALLTSCKEEVHLLLTDVVLPGKSGRDLALEVAARRNRVRVLFMSGYTDDAILHYGIFAGGFQFLAKPFTIQALTAKVREVLDRAR